MKAFDRILFFSLVPNNLIIQQPGILKNVEKFNQLSNQLNYSTQLLVFY